MNLQSLNELLWVTGGLLFLFCLLWYLNTALYADLNEAEIEEMSCRPGEFHTPEELRECGRRCKKRYESWRSTVLTLWLGSGGVLLIQSMHAYLETCRL